MTATPRTKAGRALLEMIAPTPNPDIDWSNTTVPAHVERFTAAILAIEAEAREGLDVEPEPLTRLRCLDCDAEVRAAHRYVGATAPLRSHPVRLAAAYGGQPRSDALREALELLLTATEFPIYPTDGEDTGTAVFTPQQMSRLLAAAKQARAALRESEEQG